jgi:hypothetical protein
LTIDDGLSQSLVYTILQDDPGFMGFGAKNGLNRNDALPSNELNRKPCSLSQKREKCCVGSTN